MYELICVFLCDGTALGNRRTAYPPIPGDVVELGGNPEHPVLYEVTSRTWRISPSESQVMIDVSVRPLGKRRKR